MYKKIIRPLLFSFDPERIHHFTFACIKYLHLIPGIGWIIKKTFQLEHPKLQQEVFGLKFTNPIGLAAGFDKDAKLYNELANFGFGFIEIGTLTPKGQKGNEKPRLFRIPQDESLINRMGFNNEGVYAAVERLKKRKTKVIIGGNIGKNTGVDANLTDDNYLEVFTTLFDYVDYFVVNVSCPNVGNLTALQEKEPLMRLMEKISKANQKQSKPKPLLLKIAPDLSEMELDDVIDIIKKLKLSGVVAANTSVNRTNLRTSTQELNEIGYPGGLSGKALKDRSTATIAYLYRHLGDAYPIIGVGGIFTPEDAIEKINAGAKLIQVYTGFIYEGPAMVKKINQALIKI